MLISQVNGTMVQVSSFIMSTVYLLSNYYFTNKQGDSNHQLEEFTDFHDDFNGVDEHEHDDFIIEDFAPSSDAYPPTRPPRPSRPLRHKFARPPHPSEFHKRPVTPRNPRRFRCLNPPETFLPSFLYNLRHEIMASTTKATDARLQ